MAISAILPESSDSANPPGHSIRDRSAKQPRLPVEKTTWDNWRFMLRARRVRVLGPEKLKLKLFYVAIAALTNQLLKGVDIGKFTLPLYVILFDLQLSKNTFYKLRRELFELGLLDWKQRRNRSTEYRVFTRREWASHVPDPDNPRIPTIGIRKYQPLGTYVDIYRSTESTSNAVAAIRTTVAPRPDDGQQQQQIKSEQRIEGLIRACAVRARTLKRPIDEDLERNRLANGEIDVEDLQQLADELQDEIDGRRRVRL